MSKGPAVETGRRRRLLGALRKRAHRAQSGIDRRRHGRLRAGETLSSNVGTVRDLSAGGMKVISRRKLKGQFEVALWDIHRGVRVAAEVVWTKRLGFRRHESGLRFLNVTPEIARELTALGADNPREIG